MFGDDGQCIDIYFLPLPRHLFVQRHPGTGEMWLMISLHVGMRLGHVGRVSMSV